MRFGEIPSPEDSEKQFTFRKRKNTICLDMSKVKGVDQASVVSLIKNDLKIDPDKICDVQLHPVRKFVFLKMHEDVVDAVEAAVSNGVLWTEKKITVYGWKCGSSTVHLRLYGVSPDKSVEEIEDVLSQFCVVKGLTRGKLRGLPNVSDGTIRVKVDLSGSFAALPPYIVFREEGEIWKIGSNQVIDCCWKCSCPGHIGRFCPEQPSWSKRVRKRKQRARTNKVQPETSSGDGKTTEVKKPSGVVSDLEDGELRSDDENTEIDEKEAVSISVSDDEDIEIGAKEAVSVSEAKIDSVSGPKTDWSEAVEQNDKKRKSDTIISNEEKKTAKEPERVVEPEKVITQKYSDWVAERYKLKYCWSCAEYHDRYAGNLHVKYPNFRPRGPCNHCLECDHNDIQECRKYSRKVTAFQEKKNKHLNECSKQYNRCPHCWFCFKIGHKTGECEENETME